MFVDIIVESELEERTKITPELFIMKASAYHNLDLALGELPEEYIQYYFDNERLVNKSLKKQGLLEAEGAEDQGYIGWQAPVKKKVKKIKYKGDVIQLEYDPDNGTWIPNVSFRSVTAALRYGKFLADLNN